MSTGIYAITMPKWGIEMQQGTITQWHAVPGQAVAKGDTLLDVETEKIVNSVEAPVEGVLRRILADVGSTEPVGALIAVFAQPGVADAEVDAFVAGFRPADTSFDPDAGRASGNSQASTAAIAASPAATASNPSAVAVTTEPDGGTRVSPIARRLAERLGIDVTKIKGTGTHGRVSKEDVEAYAASLQADAVPTAAKAVAGSTQDTGSQAPTRERLSAMRATIARRLLESKQTIPHYRLSIDVDLASLDTRRAELNAASPGTVSVNDLLVRATALALVRHPAVNAQLHGDEVLKFAHADVCIAVATDNGLVTPIVRAAERKTVAQIAREISDLAQRARAGKLTREEINGGTFTISNLGMFGVDRFDAIINPPQVAILAAGAAIDRVVARNGEPAVRRMATLTLSCDHRVVDGATAAKFLATLRELIELPASL
jgi:pyruvate dehydrogenase E2 component (dihydrolipoamide acetyltransferase)